MSAHSSPRKMRRLDARSCIVLNGLNIGYTYNADVEKRPGSKGKKKSSNKKMSWVGLDLAVKYYADLPEKPEVQVVLPKYIVDKVDQYYLDSWMKLGHVFISKTPGVTAEKSLDDLYTIKLAMNKNC